MGNEIDSGFHTLPRSYLKEVRQKTNRRLKELSASKHLRTPSMIKQEKQATAAELNRKSVIGFLMKHPGFLDNLIINHIAQDRVKAWLKEKRERSGDATKDEDDPDFAAELLEKNYRHRMIMLLTRTRLLYPFKYKRDDLNELIERPYTDEYEEDIESHLFAYTEVPMVDINKIFILMANNLLGKYAFPAQQLYYYLSCLEANYLDIDYHNYSHALSHAQSMYWILRKNPGVFNGLEVKCLLISAISHDVGHPGVNDSFLKATGNGLENLYSSPILESHHIQTTYLILQDINCNVFCELERDDYNQVLDEIYHDILSTSLARYKVQCENMRHMIATNLDFSSRKVRDAIKSVLMMTCDLCASWKMWQEHKSSVWSLYKEFFIQGDKEASFGLDSAPQMRRTNADKIPEYQVFFLENVILPVFQIAVKVFPNISNILDSTKENLDLWNTFL